MTIPVSKVRSIREAVVALLKGAAIPGVLDNIFPSRSRKIWPDEGDLLLVFTQDTDADEQDTAPVIYACATTLAIRVMVQAEEEEDTSDAEEEAIEARADDLSEHVLRIMQPVVSSNGPLGGLCDWIKWKGFRPMISPDGEILRNSQLLTFSVIWDMALPDTPCPDDFNISGTTLGGPTAANAPAIDATFITQQRTA